MHGVIYSFIIAHITPLILIPLSYSLYENKLPTAKPSTFVTCPQVDVTKDFDQILDETTRHGSTTTKAEGLAFTKEQLSLIENNLENGIALLTPLININFSILGVYNGADDTFDPAGHSLNDVLTPGIRLKEAVRKISLPKVKAVKPLPIVLYFSDHSSLLQNDKITSGGVGKIGGERLKFDESDALQGVYFVSIATGATVKAGLPMVKNDPSELIFLIPTELAPGEYNV